LPIRGYVVGDSLELGKCGAYLALVDQLGVECQVPPHKSC
jgi:hypothetical protein